jgi:hypothetical protein
VAKVKYLRSMTAPPVSGFCRAQEAEAPVPAGKYLYAVTSGKVSKYNPATGKLIWRRAPPRHFGYDWLAVSGNTLIASDVGCGSASEPGGIVAAYNATTGQLLWRAGIEGQSGAVTASSYVVEAGADAAGSEVAVLNLSNGGLVWSNFGCTTYDPNGPIVVGLMVISYNCDQEETIAAYKLSTGTLEWTLPTTWQLQRGDLSGSAGKHLYAIDPSGTVDSLDPQTGKLQYSLSRAVSVLAVDTSRVYATCGSSQPFNVCAYNISTGAQEWQANYSAALAAEADGVLYLDSGVALNAATGKVIKRVWSGSTASAIAVGNGRIAAVTDPRILDLYGLAGS